MATTDPHDPHVVPESDPGHAEGQGHERSDINVSRAPALVIGSAVVMVLVMAGMWLMFRWMEGQLVSVDEPLPVVTERQAGEDRQPPEPRLLADEPADLAAVQQQEVEALNTYGWVDQAQGTVRVPIDRAMALVLERGLPTASRAAPDTGPSLTPGAGSPPAAIATTERGTIRVQPAMPATTSEEQTKKQDR